MAAEPTEAQSSGSGWHQQTLATRNLRTVESCRWTNCRIPDSRVEGLCNLVAQQVTQSESWEARAGRLDRYGRRQSEVGA